MCPCPAFLHEPHAAGVDRSLQMNPEVGWGGEYGRSGKGGGAICPTVARGFSGGERKRKGGGGGGTVAMGT